MIRAHRFLFLVRVVVLHALFSFRLFCVGTPVEYSVATHADPRAGAPRIGTDFFSASNVSSQTTFNAYTKQTGAFTVKDWIGTVPFQGSTRACLYFVASALTSGLMRQAVCREPKPGDKFEVSSRDLLNQLHQGDRWSTAREPAYDS